MSPEYGPQLNSAAHCKARSFLTPTAPNPALACTANKSKYKNAYVYFPYRFLPVPICREPGCDTADRVSKISTQAVPIWDAATYHVPVHPSLP